MTDIGVSSDEMLLSLDAVAFRMDGDDLIYSRRVDLPGTLSAFDEALGDDAPRVRAARQTAASYMIEYEANGLRVREIGKRDETGALVGLTQILGRQASAQMRLLTRDDILTALNDRRVRVALQPIVDATTHKVHHYECLMRAVSDTGAPWPTPVLIRSAEQLGLVPLLDRRALELAARTLIGRPKLALALNVSAQTVASKSAADDYLQALKMLGPAARRLTIELTETIAVDDPTMAARFATRARAMGCRFAIDDFGSGYTTFRNLMAIEADSIKIDGDFVDDILISPLAQTFVRMMVDLAQTFGVETVAERVETAEMAAKLTELGVDRLQGYYFGRPELDLEKLLAA